MKKCTTCKIEVKENLTRCPLCQSELEKLEDTDETILEETSYPKNIEKQKNYTLLIKIVGFVVFIISVLAIFFNIILPSHNAWSLIVILVVTTIWYNLIIVVKYHKSILKCLWQQIIDVILVAMLIDFLAGKLGWSLTLVMPLLFTIAMVVMYILSKMLHLAVGDYMIYLLMNGLFGLTPIFVLYSHIGLDIRWPSYVCILVSIISSFGLIVFEGKAMWNELKRRLYI